MLTFKTISTTPTFGILLIYIDGLPIRGKIKEGSTATAEGVSNKFSKKYQKLDG